MEIAFKCDVFMGQALPVLSHHHLCGTRGTGASPSQGRGLLEKQAAAGWLPCKELVDRCRSLLSADYMRACGAVRAPPTLRPALRWPSSYQNYLSTAEMGGSSG